MRASWLVLTLLVCRAHAADRRPCAPTDRAYGAADRELEAVHQAIEALPLDGDPAALIARVEALSRTRCFALLEQGVSLPTRSALALKTYWKDGGRQHLRSYLDLGRPGMHPLFQPPSLRRTMGEVYRVGHPLASLVCPPAERSCGAETAAWGLRLQTVLDGPAPAGVCEHHPVPAPDGCGRLALRAPASQRFRRFADCVYHARPSRRVPALGRLRALAGGWLIVSGVGLTRDGCDEDRAFDLASGATFRVSSCIVLDTQR